MKPSDAPGQNEPGLREHGLREHGSRVDGHNGRRSPGGPEAERQQTGQQETEHWRVGAAAQSLALPPGLAMAGYIRRTETARGTLDPLEARAVVIEWGGERAVLVVLDLLYAPHWLSTRVGEAVAWRGLADPSHLIVSATHTHSGPALQPEMEAAGQVVEAAADAVARAVAELRPARLTALHPVIAGIGANRRHGGPPHDETAHILVAHEVRSSGSRSPQDQHLDAQPRTTSDHAVIATVVEYGCHPTVLEHDNLDYSPDLPGHARATIERLMGGTAIVVQGGAGDINPVYQAHTPTDCARIGGAFGAAVAQAVMRAGDPHREHRTISLSWNREEPVEASVAACEIPPGEIRAVTCRAVVPTRPAPDPIAASAELQRARTDWSVCEPGPHRDELGAVLGERWADDLRAGAPSITRALDPVPTAPFEVQVRALHLGDSFAIAAVPGENFSAAVAAMHAAAPGAAGAIIAGYARQSVGYLPPLDEIAASGYEVGAAVLEPGAAEVVVELTAASLKG